MKSLFVTIAAAAVVCSSALCAASSGAPDNGELIKYSDFFADSTLRVDYTFAAADAHPQIFVDCLHKSPGWYGRRNYLDSLPYVANANMEMVDTLTGKVIYRIGFSSLFHEWLSTPEALTTPKAMGHTILMPLPHRAAKITVRLLDTRHDTIAEMSHLYSPEDILVKGLRRADPPKMEYVHKAGDPKEKIDVAILAEGYTQEEMPTFREDAAKTVEALFSHEPFASRRDDFNFVAVFTPSADSGMSVPRDNVWKSTAFSSHFDTFYSARYLTTTHLADIHNALIDVPYEHIIVLANTDVYGGGGIYNSYTLTTAGHEMFQPVVVHEFGHSFGGLADEYFYEQDVFTDYYPLDVEPWEPNITTLVDFNSKWKEILPAGIPKPTPVEKAEKYPAGLYEGGGYAFHGVYRPAFDCRMRTNKAPAFCPACQRALSKLIDFYTGCCR